MIETATPRHELDGNQAAPRLNKQLFEVVPDCLSLQALNFFQQQDVKAFDPNIPPDFKKNYLFHVQSGMRIHELYALMNGVLDADGDEDPDDEGTKGASLATWIRDHRNSDLRDRD